METCLNHINEFLCNSLTVYI